MDWVLLANLLIKFLGPLLQAWLESLFARAAAELSAPGAIIPDVYGMTSSDVDKLMVDKAREIFEQEAKKVWLVNLWGQAKIYNRRKYFERAADEILWHAGQFTKVARARMSQPNTDPSLLPQVPVLTASDVKMFSKF
jgi:hypothetical protein